MQGSQSAAVFAYQPFGGLRFRLNDNMGVCVEYHYFATTRATWPTGWMSPKPTVARVVTVK